MSDIHFNPQNPLDALQIWLEPFLNFEKSPSKDFFWLDTMEFLAEKCGNPQNAFNSFHIAGSKGKGSVSTFIASILTEANLDCGLYTSPHLLSFSERVTQNHKVLSEAIYTKAYKTLSQTIDSIIPKSYPNKREPSWFELVTLFAFIAFREAHFSWAVFETGLGGRLDATNVIRPRASIITEIELEHQEYLGNSIEEIAFEKAGIIKTSIPVFCASKENAAVEVIKSQAKKMAAAYFHLDDFVEDFSYYYKDGLMFIEAKMPKLFEKSLHTSLQLLGEYQLRNALLASLVVKTMLPEISQNQIEKGLSNAFLPARFQVLPKTENKALIVCDGAHTKKSISHCLNTLGSVFINKKQNENCMLTNKNEKEKTLRKSFSLLFACAIDKNIDEIAKLLLESYYFDSIILTRPGIFKQSDLKKINDSFQKAVKNLGDNKKDLECSLPKISLIEDHEEAIKKAIANAFEKNQSLLVTGSFYLVAELHSFLKKESIFSSTSA